MRLNSRQAESRSGSRTSSINERGAKLFLGGKSNLDKERKRTKKKERFGKGRPVETAAAVEIDKGGLRQLLVNDFHRCLKKPTQEPLRLFHSYAQARRRLIYKPIFKRQRSTLIMLFFGPKNGEHLTHGAIVVRLQWGHVRQQRRRSNAEEGCQNSLSAHYR